MSIKVRERRDLKNYSNNNNKLYNTELSNKIIMSKYELSVDHLLLHGPTAWNLWSSVLSFWVQWVMTKKVVELIACWPWLGGRRDNGEI